MISAQVAAKTSVPIFNEDRLNFGVLDLRNTDLSEENIQLSGEVPFIWRQLLDSMPADENLPLFAFPSVWQGQVLGTDTITNVGFGTYFFQVILPKGTANNKQVLGLGLPHSYSAYKLLLNGVEIASNGKVANTQRDYVPYWKPQTVTFTPARDTLHFALQIANFSHHKGGIKDEITIGLADEITFFFEREIAFDFILTGCLLMGGLFFLGFYLFGKNDNALLFFSLFCINYSYRIIGAKNYGLHYILPDMSWNVAINLEYLTFYLSVAFFLIYSYLFYKEKFSELVIKILVALSLIFLIITLVTPPLFFTQLLNPFFLVIHVASIYIIWVYIDAFRSKMEGATFAILSMVVFIFSFTYDIIAYYGYIEKYNTIVFVSYLLFFFFQSLILSNRFAKTYREAIKESLAAHIAKIDFLSTVSHEIRTPLNAIVGMSNLIKVERDQEDNLMTLKQSAQNLLHLINDILDYTKISAGKIEVDNKPMDLHSLMNNMVRGFLARKDHNHAISVLIDMDPETPKYIIGDPMRLTQILNNLVGNALKFTDVGYVKVSVKPEEVGKEKTKVRFTVEDTGMGIPEDKFEDIFETFTQLDNSTTRRHGGTGLGLSITKKTLNILKCDIEVKSTLGVGSIFSFVLPFKLASKQDTDQLLNIKVAEDHILENVRILVVEDNEMNILVTKKFLQKWNVKFDIAKNGKESLEVFNNHDLVLMDLQMPEMDGYEATKIMRERNIKVPIIALTASALLNIREKIYSAGMNDYILKPFEPEDLFLKMKTHLGANQSVNA